MWRDMYLFTNISVSSLKREHQLKHKQICSLCAQGNVVKAATASNQSRVRIATSFINTQKKNTHTRPQAWKTIQSLTSGFLFYNGIKQHNPGHKRHVTRKKRRRLAKDVFKLKLDSLPFLCTADHS